MQKSRPRNRARAVLFDRLAEPRPSYGERYEPVLDLDGEGLRRSILRELADLLNTRAPYGLGESVGRPLSTVEYGLPDYTGRLTRDPETRELLARAIERVVEAYEPRLRHVQVSIEAADKSWRALTVEFHADVCVGPPLPSPLTLTLDHRGIFVLPGGRRT